MDRSKGCKKNIIRATGEYGEWLLPNNRPIPSFNPPESLHFGPTPEQHGYIINRDNTESMLFRPIANHQPGCRSAFQVQKSLPLIIRPEDVEKKSS